MPTIYVMLTVLAAAAIAFTALVNFTRPGWLLNNMAQAGVPRSRLPLLGALKAAGAAGLLVGIAVPLIGVAAAACLVLFFILATATVLRARCWAQIPYPTTFLLLAAGSLAMQLSAF
jgi:DoxX-like family